VVLSLGSTHAAGLTDHIWTPAEVFIFKAPPPCWTPPKRRGLPSKATQALVATAHKIARTVYYMLKHRVAYHGIGAQGYETQQRERELTYLQRKAAKLGFELTPKQAAVPS